MVMAGLTDMRPFRMTGASVAIIMNSLLVPVLIRMEISGPFIVSPDPTPARRFTVVGSSRSTGTARQLPLLVVFALRGALESILRAMRFTPTTKAPGMAQAH